MVNAPQFDSHSELEASEWLNDTKNLMDNGQWPKECERCYRDESVGNKSIRQHALETHGELLGIREDYLVLGGILDNTCNSACQFCNERLSTKIGSLKNKEYPIINNSRRIKSIELDRVVELDINGGEPSASKNYKSLLKKLPPNVRYLRVNTNCSKVLGELAEIQNSGIKVIVTVSFDGIGAVHDYVRWPIKWTKFEENLLAYKNMGLHELNLWTTVNALNIGDMENIIDYVKANNYKHSWATLSTPTELNIEYANLLTLPAKVKLKSSKHIELQKLSDIVATKSNNQLDLDKFIEEQDSLRDISIEDYI